MRITYKTMGAIMGLMMMLAGCGGGTLKTQTFTANATWIAPLTVTSLATASGKGATGYPATSGGYGPNVTRTAAVVTVTGYGANIPSNADGFNAGAAQWQDWQSYGDQAVSYLNSGSSTYPSVAVNQYLNGYLDTIGSNTAGVVIVGTAYKSNSAGWKTSGAITSADNGVQSVTWQERGAYVGPTSATTGASATAFGKTFPGGVGGAASLTTYGNVAVTPGAQYSIVVPSGGVVTITYYG